MDLLLLFPEFVSPGIAVDNVGAGPLQQADAAGVDEGERIGAGDGHGGVLHWQARHSS